LTNLRCWPAADRSLTFAARIKATATRPKNPSRERKRAVSIALATLPLSVRIPRANIAAPSEAVALRVGLRASAHAEAPPKDLAQRAERITKTAALEYARKNLRVNAVCPGSTMIPMMIKGLARDPRLEEAYKASHPLGRLGTPEDIGEAVVWMSSAEASFVTGLALPVDGGYTAH
jgi:hypothetical protein